MDGRVRSGRLRALLLVIFGVAASTLLIGGALAGLSASSAFSASAADGVDDFHFDSLDADYTLTRADDGTSRMTVVEEFVAAFPDYDQNHGMRRAIPDSYNGQPLHPHLVSITDENGTPRPQETDSDDGTFTMTSRSDGYLRGGQTFVFTYTLENVTWSFSDTGQEFYWDVNGTDWVQQFDRMSARLHLDAELAAQLSGQQRCYVGQQNATDACVSIAVDPTADGGVVVTATDDEVFAFETLTMAVGFEDSTFVLFNTSFFASPWGWLQLVTALGALVAGAMALRALYAHGRDAAGRPTIIAEYTPPAGMDALHGAILLGRKSKAIPAEVLEQAVVGSIRILEGPKKFWGSAPLIAELVDGSRADEDGRMLLRGLFPSGTPRETYEFGRQDRRFSSTAQNILTTAEREVMSRGFRRTIPRHVWLWPLAIGIASSVLVTLFGVLAYLGDVKSAIPVVLIIGSAVVLVMITLLIARKPLTPLGAETRDHLVGLKVFIEWAEADRIRMLQSPAGAERVAVSVDDPRQMLKLYEELLPYAVVFGQEKKWSEQLATLYATVGAAGPVWYYGAGGFDASSFSSGIGTLSATAASSSSTSGGSGGGGGAGGGGGGGGGGGV